MKHLAVSKQTSLLLIIIFGILLTGQNLFAQGKTVTPERGFTPGNSYAISNIETISQISGNLMLNIPLGALPPGRGGAGAGINLNYNSKIWRVEIPEPVAPDYWEIENLYPDEDGGWNYQYQYKLKGDFRQLDPGNCEQRLYIVAPDGSQHFLWLKDYTDALGRISVFPDGTFDCAYPAGFRAQSSNLTFFTLDGTFMRVEVEGDNDANFENNRWTLYLPDGSYIIHNPNHSTNPLANGTLQRVVDRNGNSVDVIENSSDTSYNNHRTTTIKDQLNRTVIIEYNAATNQDWIRSKGYNGADLTTKVQWKTITVNKTYNWCPTNCTGNAYKTLATNFRMVEKIYLPQQAGDTYSDTDLYYQFDYNATATANPSTGWGEVSKVTLPSGAYSTYDYTSDGSGIGIRYQGVTENRPSQKTLNYLKEYDGGSSLETETWSYSVCGGGLYTDTCTTTAPDGSVSTEYTAGWNGAAYPTNSMYNEGFKKPYKSVAGNGTVVERIYANNIPAEASLIASANQFVKYELTSITDNAGNLSKTAVKEFAQDKNGNTTEVKEYDFISASSSLIQRDSNGRATGIGSGMSSYLKRITKTDYYNDAPDSASTTYTDTDSYHLSGNPRLLNLVKAAEVQNASGTPQTRSEITYDYTSYSTNTKGGNPTATKSWDSFKGGSSQAYSNPLTSSNSISTSATYNSYGMPTLTTDGRGYQTQITYGSVTTPSGTVTDLYPTQTVAAYGTSIARTSTAAYDFLTGLITTATDADNSVSTVTTYDDLGRPTKVAAANGTILETWVQTNYDDTNRLVIVKSDIETKGDARKVATQFYDQLGRVRLSKTLEDASIQSATNETDGIKVQTRYLTTSGGYSYQLTSNPYRATTSSGATNEPTMGWTRSKSYKDGKHSEVETFAGATLPQPFLTSGYNTSSTGKVQTDADADRTLVTDQAGKQRISKTNALGQLTDVWEVKASDSSTVSVSFPSQSLAAGYQTSYTYDALSNLTSVSQGSQSRTFTYSSLSRLKSAANPESGTINYAYDANGNLTTKTDSRGVQIAYAYDALNRVTSRSYSNEPSGQDTTPNVAYTYDNLTNAKGRLTKVTATRAGTNAFSAVTDYQAFDKLGRVTQSQQTVDGTSYGTTAQTYTYNLAGALIEEMYPSGRVVKNVLDTDGDLSLVQSKKNANSGYWNYAKSFTYTAAGAVSSMQLGNGRWESTVFNSRLQPININLGTTQGATDKLNLVFTYSTPNTADNNGNVLTQTITTPSETRGGNTYSAFTATQTYTYDELNRLKSAAETIPAQTGWKQTFTYDRYGNRNFDTSVSGNTTTLGSCATAICNPQASASNNKFSTSDGYTYDNAGNTKVDALGRTFTYDAENKQTEVKNSSNVSIGQYFYDGDGKRVKKYIPTTGETTIFVYDASGKMVAEYSTTVASVSTAQVSYLTSDHLGSPRVNTDANGQVTSRHDYQPFGEEIAVISGNTARAGYSTDTVRQKFTGYEREAETPDLDFAKARIYINGLGRFTSVDPLLSSGKIENSQSWNRYTYALDNPLRFIDPTGMYVWDKSLGGDAGDWEISAGIRHQRNNFRQGLARANANLEKIKTLYGDKSEKYLNAKKAVESYGDEGDKGVTIKVVADSDQDTDGLTSGKKGNVTVSFRDGWLSKGNGLGENKDIPSQTEGLIAHEGYHVSLKNAGKIMDEYTEEFNAYTIQSVLAQVENPTSGATYFQLKSGDKAYVWDSAWQAVDIDTKREEGIKAIIKEVYPNAKPPVKKKKP